MARRVPVEQEVESSKKYFASEYYGDLDPSLGKVCGATTERLRHGFREDARLAGHSFTGMAFRRA